MARQEASHAKRMQQPRSPKSSPPQGSMRETGERDETYDLISVLYHSLQGAETIGQMLLDVGAAGNEEIRSFLQETREEYIDRAHKAKLLLATQLESGEEGEEEEEEED